MNIYYFRISNDNDKIKMEPMKLHHIVYVCRPLIESWQTWEYYEDYDIITLPALAFEAGGVTEFNGLVEAESFDEAKEKVRRLKEALLLLEE